MDDVWTVTESDWLGYSRTDGVGVVLVTQLRPEHAASLRAALARPADPARVTDAATRLMQWLHESPSGCAICGVIDGDHEPDMPCAPLFDALGTSHGY